LLRRIKDLRPPSLCTCSNDRATLATQQFVQALGGTPTVLLRLASPRAASSIARAATRS